MNKNYGKLSGYPVKIPAIIQFKINPNDPDVVLVPERTVYQPRTADNKPWKDVAEIKEGHWYIAVAPDGFIMCCEQDPTMCIVAEGDTWVIEHPGPREAIWMKKWDGSKVVEYESTH